MRRAEPFECKDSETSQHRHLWKSATLSCLLNALKVSGKHVFGLNDLNDCMWQVVMNAGLCPLFILPGRL